MSEMIQVEDIDDEGFIERHNVKELEERNRFQVYKDSVFTLGRRLTEVVASETKQGRSRSGSFAAFADVPRFTEEGPTSIAAPFPPRNFPLPADF